MPIMTPRLVQQLRAIIQKHHNAFIVNAFGRDAVPQEVYAELARQGLVQPGARATLDDAYVYGQVKAYLEDPRVAGWSGQQVRDWVARNPMPLTPDEEEAAKTARLTGAQYVTGLGNTVDRQTGQLLIEADHQLRQTMQRQIADATAQDITTRETVRKLKSDLGWATQDWTRNLDRIAITEKTNAMRLGTADGIRRRGGDQAHVFFRPMPGACKSCLSLHIGPDGQPRIFRLDQLPGPGANVGRRQADWTQNLGTIHPHCQCQMQRVPVGWGFDEDGTLVPGGRLGVVTDLETGAEKSEHRPRAAAEVQRRGPRLVLRPNQLQKGRPLAGRLSFQGLPVSLEHDVGGVREWRDGGSGETGRTTMQHRYGYIRLTEGLDGDHLDCFVGPDPLAETAWVVNQRRKTPGGEFHGLDEQKVMLGFGSAQEAATAYLAHYDDPRFLGSLEELPVADLKAQLRAAGGQKGRVKGTVVAGLDIQKAAATLNDTQAAHEVPAILGGQDIEADGNVTTGSGAMLQNRAPSRPVNQQDYAGQRDYLQAGQPRTYVIRRDPRVYEFDSDHIDWKQPVNMDDGVMATSHDGLQAIERDNVARQTLQNTLVPRNTANPGWQPQGSLRLEDQPSPHEVQQPTTPEETLVSPGDNPAPPQPHDRQGKVRKARPPRTPVRSLA